MVKLVKRSHAQFLVQHRANSKHAVVLLALSLFFQIASSLASHTVVLNK